MANGRKKRIHAARRRFQNPYAFLEELELEGAEAAASKEHASASQEQISADRERFQNQYLHLSEEGEFAADLPISNDDLASRESEDAAQPGDHPHFELKHRKEPGTYSDREIEEIARLLQLTLWNNRHIIWQHDTPTDPIGVLNFQAAFDLVDYQHHVVDSLGSIQTDVGKKEVAAVLEPSKRRVMLSSWSSSLI